VRALASRARLLAALLVSLAALPAVPARGADCTFTPIFGEHDTACPFLGLPTITPVAMNSDGLVVGNRAPCLGQNFDVPAVWQAGEEHSSDLELPWPYDRAYCADVTEDGIIIGGIDFPDGQSGNYRAFLLNWHTGEINLMWPPPGKYQLQTNIRIYGVNRDLQWCGAMEFWDGTTWSNLAPFRANGTNYEFLFDGGSGAEAFDIADDGRVAGRYYNSRAQELWGCTWSPDGSFTPLPPLPGHHSSNAQFVNGSGLVAVKSQGTPWSNRHAYVWRPDGTIKQLVGIGGSTTVMALLDLNEAGEVFVQGLTGGTSPNCIWKDGHCIPLQENIEYEGPELLPAGSLISDRGDVVLRNTQTDQVMFVQRRPSPKQGDLDRNCTIGADDLLGLLESWGPGEGFLPGDLDDSGEVGMTDLVILLTNWSPPTGS